MWQKRKRISRRDFLGEAALAAGGFVLAACTPHAPASVTEAATATPTVKPPATETPKPTVTVTLAPSDTPTVTSTPEIRFNTGGEMTEYQKGLFRDTEEAFRKNWEYWAGAKPPLVSKDAWNQRTAYIFVDGKNPYSLGVVWEFPGEALGYSFAWSHKGPVTTSPTENDQNGGVLLLSNPLRLTRTGTEENGTEYQLGWYGGKWVRVDVKTKTVEKVINDQGVFEGGDGILNNLEERCPNPVIYKGKYQGVEIPVQLSTDSSYINYSVRLRDPGYAGKLSEISAKLLYYWWELKNRGKLIEDFMATWKSGSLDSVQVEANFPSNTEYKAVPANVNLQGLTVHFVLVDHNNWKWRGKLFNKPNTSGGVGIYTNGSELVVLVGICNNHIGHTHSDIDPYGPEVDLVGLGLVTGSFSTFYPIRNTLQVVRQCR
jgi:hypothetical protein